MVETVLAGLDRRRFPWVGEGREPHEDEKAAAALATASLMATERVRTSGATRPGWSRRAAVADALRRAGFREVAAPRVIRTLEEAPGPGEFCTERTFGDRKADLVVGLWDRRRMPLECKASNSATNSYKRVNHEAANKAETWLQDFGRSRSCPPPCRASSSGPTGGRPGARLTPPLGPPPRRHARLDLTHPALRVHPADRAGCIVAPVPPPERR